MEAEKRRTLWKTERRGEEGKKKERKSRKQGKIKVERTDGRGYIAPPTQIADAATAYRIFAWNLRAVVT